MTKTNAVAAINSEGFLEFFSTEERAQDAGATQIIPVWVHKSVLKNLKK